MEEEPQEKLAQIVDFLATQEADVIALQEVNQLISAKEIIPDDYFCPQEKQHPIREDKNYTKKTKQMASLKNLPLALYEIIYLIFQSYFLIVDCLFG